MISKNVLLVKCLFVKLTDEIMGDYRALWVLKRGWFDVYLVDCQIDADCEMNVLMTNPIQWAHDAMTTSFLCENDVVLV